MENNNTPQAAQATSEKKDATDAERYPLIESPIYRRCVEDVVNHVQITIASRGGVDNLKSSPLTQLAKAGNLNADFMLRHFAGIFDHNSPLSSGQRRAVKAILTDAARKMAEMAQAVNAKAAQEQQAQNPAGEAQPQEQEGGAYE